METLVAANLRALLGKLNQTCQKSLSEAVGLCRSRRNDYVELEHWLLKLLEVPDTDLKLLLAHYQVDAGQVVRELTRALDKMRRGSDTKPGWAREVEDTIREAWLLATLDYNRQKIRSGYLLVALMNERSISQKLLPSVPALGQIPTEKLRTELREIIAGSAEDADDIISADVSSTGAAPGAPVDSKTPALDQFTTDLTGRARKGEIDPVVGRDAEIRQCIDILTRRRQNNPILTGEAGVGKTAVVEGFALRIAAGDVPEALKTAVIRVLDLGLLQAGAGVKGEFENRLKSVISEAKASPVPLILFIDEAHTLIGAGGAAGQGDAANLLKPALARGELRTIAATTWAEYKKFFEEDPALKRRFQVVKVDEPDIAKATRMMRGLTAMLEKHHKTIILDEAVEDAVKLSHRYITDRQLPDKAVSLLDTTCARVALSQSTTPPALEDSRREIEQLNVEIGILNREEATGAEHAARLKELKELLAVAETRRTTLEKQLTREREIVTKIQDTRKKIEANRAKPQDGKPAEAPALLEELNKLKTELRSVQGDTALTHPVVDRQAVAAVVSNWTGIPVGKMVLDEIKTILALQERMQERVIGQQKALEVIAERMRTARANLLDPKRPLGIFLLVGPSGVGKTETAMALSDILYGGSRNLVVINMSEYKESSKISNLTGSAKGLVGYGTGGVLTEAVRRKPYSVVLLDEVEKAHVDVQELFYQVFDKGMLQDSSGNEVDFKNTIILLTSNAGTDTIMQACSDPNDIPSAVELAEILRPDLLKSFKPALLGRMTVVPYFPLSDEVIRHIIKLQMKRVGERLHANHRAVFTYDDTVIDTIASRCKDVESGARNVDQIITGTLLPSIAREFLTRLAEGQAVERVTVGVEADGQFQYRFNEK
jgi:type VI secretion system protein VasG